MAKDETKKINSLFGNIFLLVMVAGFLISISFYFLSYFIDDQSMKDIIKDVSMIILGAVTASVIHEKVLGDYYKNQYYDQVKTALSPNFEAIELKVGEGISKIVPEIKEETIESIQDIKDRVNEATKYMLNGIGVLSGAKSSGIIGIFPTRYDEVASETFVQILKKDLKEEKNEIRIMGISLGDFFLDRGGLHKDFMELIDNNCKKPGRRIRALIVHPKCEALKERAKWETGKECYYIPAFYASTTFIETEGAAKISKRLCENFGNCLEVRLYKQPPMSFLILTTRFAFVESYHYGNRGSNAPLFQIQAGNSLYKNYEAHFERIWAEAEPVIRYDPFAN